VTPVVNWLFLHWCHVFRISLLFWQDYISVWQTLKVFDSIVHSYQRLLFALKAIIGRDTCGFGIISAPSRVRIPTDCARIAHSGGSGAEWVLGLWRTSGSWSLQFQHLLRHPAQAQRVCHSTPRTAQRRGETPWEQVLIPTPQSFKYHPRKVQTYL